MAIERHPFGDRKDLMRLPLSIHLSAGYVRAGTAVSVMAELPPIGIEPQHPALAGYIYRIYVIFSHRFSLRNAWTTLPSETLQTDLACET
jgi:hypothetical protein